jgi:murein DD-endopeptidase MepM/ murein hydrolase activator NlpD
VARFGGDALVRRLGPPAGAGGTDVAAGATRVVYVDIALPEGMATPWSIDYDVLATTATVQMGAVGSVAVNSKPPAPLGPPLAGGPWAAVHHPDWERGHRRVFYTVDGVTRLPGRFTIDFVRLDDAGRTTRGDRDLVASALGYGAPVLAVADATVAATRNDMSEPERVSARMKHPQQDAAGNFVSLDLGEGRFAVYEHLKPGSVRVAPGQRVRRGDVIAQLGFTGDSTGPHLHLHVGDAAAPLAAEGLPFVFEQFEVLGRYPDIAAMGTARWTPDGAGTRRGERPAPNVVIDFRPDRR